MSKYCVLIENVLHELNLLVSANFAVLLLVSGLNQKPVFGHTLVSGLMEEAVEAAEATAEAEDAFGNCTIPQVSLVLSVVEFQVW